LPTADVAAGARRDRVCNGRRLGSLGVEGSCRVMCEGELLAIYRDEGDGARAEVVLCAG
jgi:tRNA pseudouridine55 synthase